MRAACLLLFLAASLRVWSTPLAQDNYLLIDQAGIEAAKRKAATQPWAKAELEAVLKRAAQEVKRTVDLPPRGGQWPHWYSCKKDGAQLVTDSPTSHRCRVCGTVYHGDPYDAVVFYREHANWSQAIRTLGLAYRFTGRKEYAEKAGEILKAYADRYASYPLHDKDGQPKVGGGHIMAQTLDESVWLIPVTFGYALVREALPAPARAHIEQDLLVAGAEVIRTHKMGIHNIQCWKNSAVGLAGLAANNEALVREAIDDPQRGFRAQITKGVTDDGLWYEGSLGYHRYTMDALWPLAEAARLNGLDLYSDRFRSLFDAPLNLALPDGEAPGFNDNSGGNVQSAAALYELAFARWKRPEYGRLAAHSDRQNLQALLYGVETLPEGPFIPRASVVMKQAGFAMLRAQGNAVAIRFGSHGGGHGHPDKLNLVTYGAGQLFGLDPGSINYGVPLHREWYRTTIAHNTVAVDGRDQSSADGELEEWSDNSLTARADAVYPGVKLQRALRFDGRTLQDRYTCSSAAEHDYDYAFHAAGKLHTSLELKPRAPLSYRHVEQVCEAHPEGDWWAEWEQDGVRYRVGVKGMAGTVVYTGVGPGRNPADRVPLIIIRRHAKQTVYECTHAFGVK
ncbi:MAG TPA: alginate lyase family protein [Bacillota bacterium]|nr:alginate lyase family protein [Bacillota bacterium]